MTGDSWASYQSALPPEARADGEPDEPTDLEATDLEVVSAPCPGCGKMIRVPADAEGDCECCGPACVRIVCDRMDAEIAAWRVAELAEVEARLVDCWCPGCGCAMRATPEEIKIEQCCTPSCWQAYVSRVYAAQDKTPPGVWDDIPL